MVCARVRVSNAQSSGVSHFMGLGVLPKSDESYLADHDGVGMADYEKFSTGRFMVSAYSNRLTDRMSSLWLFSNDLLRFLVQQSERGGLREAGAEMALNLSYVNYYIAQSLSVLSNSSSGLTKADQNLDARELNDFLDGRPFMSGLLRQAVERGSSDLGSHVLAVKRLLLGALTNVTMKKDRLEGLSVPVKEQELDGLRTMLDTDTATYDEFRKALREYDAESGPIEFQTTNRLMILYGQPEKHSSENKKEMIALGCEHIFPNAQQFVFTFSHLAKTETLLILLVDPFIRPVVASIYYYANSGWIEGGKNLRDKFDEAIAREGDFNEGALRIFAKTELAPMSAYGGGANEVSEMMKQDESLAVSRKNVLSAFERLHEIYHRERPSTDTGSRPTGRRRASANRSK